VDKPVNVLASPGLKLSEIVAAGAQRISVGGGLAWAAVSGLATAAEEIRDAGSFESLRAPRDLNDWLRP
jgi:2-methylisocitrate lyase-like PEP mutase family enzyme